MSRCRPSACRSFLFSSKSLAPLRSAAHLSGTREPMGLGWVFGGPQPMGFQTGHPDRMVQVWLEHVGALRDTPDRVATSNVRHRHRVETPPDRPMNTPEATGFLRGITSTASQTSTPRGSFPATIQITASCTSACFGNHFNDTRMPRGSVCSVLMILSHSRRTNCFGPIACIHQLTS